MKNYKWLGFGTKGEHPDILLADIRKGVGKTVEDVRNLSFDDNTFEGVELHHVIEHLVHKDADKALSEILRVLKPNGEFHISAPDLDACARTLLTGNEIILNNIYSDDDIPEQQHKWGYTKRSMRELLNKAGFKDIREAAITEPHEFRFVCRKGL